MLAISLGGYGALVRKTTAPTPPRPCTLAARIGIGLDFGLPLVKTGARDRCDVTDTATGTALTLSGWALQLSAWAFTTLFIAWFTGAVWKT